MRGGFSAPRRPRSAFKESSQEEALPLRAPRERSRKEKPVLGSSASSSSRSRNNKKKRSVLSEAQLPGSDHDQEEDGYETTEQLSPSPSRCSPAFSDEDDEPPQARRRRESSSSAPKLKLPHKVPESNIISAGLGAIPRKARSAFVKRAHEGTSSVQPISDFTTTALHCFSAAKAQSPPNCNGRIRSVSPSPSAAKPTRKMKPIGTNPRPAKFLKVSAAFSEQEVEVAEVLFGFARQITSAEENLNDLKAASSSSPSLPPNISSPIRVSSPISASPSLLAQPAEGPKKKRPRPIKIDEIGSPAAPATALVSCQSAGMEIVSSDNADGVGGFIHGIANVPPPIISATQDYVTSLSFGQRYGEMIRETVTVSETIRVKFEDSDVVDPLAEVKATDVPVKEDGASKSVRNQIEADKIDRQTDVLLSENPVAQFESPVMSPSTVDAKIASLEKLEIDLMAPLEKDADSSENDNNNVAADSTSAELPAEGTMGVSNVFEGKSISVDKVRYQEKREESPEYKEREMSFCKREPREESVIEQPIKEENIEENDHIDSTQGNDIDSSKQLPQKSGKIFRTDSRIQKLDKPDVPSPAVSASCVVSSSASGVAGPSPISMAVAGWPGALSALGYFGPMPATWPGTPSLPGVMPVEGNLMKGIQQWQKFKRSATHAYIAHFIDYQQQIARNPFWATTYGSSTALYGGKPYNLNIPSTPATETILGSSLLGSDPFLPARNSNITGSSCNDSNIATVALAAISGHNLKEKAASSYDNALRKSYAQQQEAQPTSSVTVQHNLPSFGFPITESGTSTSAIAVNTGNACPLVNGKNSGTGPPLHAGASANLAGGTATANSSFASMANAQAQYLAMLQQTGFHFPLPPVHFGATNTGTHNHLGHPQVFNGSYYAAHLLHPPTHPQQQCQQNPSNTGSSSQKHQQQFNFSSPQQQTPSSSQQHHLFSSSQTSQPERGYTSGGDIPSTADRKLPLGQKNLYSQGSPINSNSNTNPATLLATNSLGHSQDFTMVTAFGGKHNVKQQQMQVSLQPHVSDPSLEISLKGQQCNQTTKQPVGRVKGIAQSTLSNYDHITGASNLSKFQEASISGQSQKQQDQHPPEWKASSALPTSVGVSHQTVMAGAIRNSSQQVHHQQVSSNLLANLPGGAIPQAVFTTSTKNYGQQSRNQHGNSSSASVSKSKTMGIPTSKTVTGSKGTVSLPQRSIAPTSGKRSSPNHMSPSLSGNKPSQQQQTQSTTSMGSGQVMGLKNQQYYTQAHFNPQQSYSLQKQSLPQQIHQQLLFQQNHFLQQAVQQSQLSSQSAQHAVVHQQHLQIQGLNYSQPSFNNHHPQQEQRQQILPASSTPSDQVTSSTLSGGLPNLSLASSGKSSAKIVPAGLVKANNIGTTVLQEQYSPLNDMVSTQKQCDSPIATLSPHRVQAASVIEKHPEQKSEPDCLLQDEVNGVHSVDLNICAQARTHVSTSSVQDSSILKATGNLKKAQGGNNEECMSGHCGTNLSVVPSGHTYQDLGSASSEQTPPMPVQQIPVSRASDLSAQS